MRVDDKKILIISHNPLSRVNNNGKTLTSIFKGVSEENIYQIYLNTDIPDYSDNCHYLQINERQILESLVCWKNLCCQEVSATPDVVSSATIGVNSFGIHTKRLLRECIWQIDIWKSKLNNWLQDKQFNVVFFMAGDGLFAYDIYRFVMERVNAKGCLFFTDDYIIGKPSYSPVALFRQLLLKKRVKDTLQITDELYVISDEMKNAYSKLFNKKGHIVRNFSIEKQISEKEKFREPQKRTLTMVYAGGLHYNRWKVLTEVANTLKEINEFSRIKCQLKIYSSQNISRDIISNIVVKDVSEFCGSAPAAEIPSIYAKADILLHVESTDKKAIASTKYSFSTKIPEYLSAGKCVLAVGPSGVASINYLSNFACVVCERIKLKHFLTRLIDDEDYRNRIKSSCEEQYKKDFSPIEQENCLKQILSIL